MAPAGRALALVLGALLVVGSVAADAPRLKFFCNTTSTCEPCRDFKSVHCRTGGFEQRLVCVSEIETAALSCDIVRDIQGAPFPAGSRHDIHERCSPQVRIGVLPFAGACSLGAAASFGAVTWRKRVTSRH